MKLELKLLLLFVSLSIVLSRLHLFNYGLSYFLSELFLSLGLFFGVLNFVSAEKLNYLFYRKILTPKNNKK